MQMQYKLPLAKFAARICKLHDQKKVLEHSIAALYRDARQSGIDRLSLKTAVKNFLKSERGEVVYDSAPQVDDTSLDPELEKHLSRIDVALAKFRERKLI